ncbi:MAG: RluA family pseudouridine synthase [Planctomycetota bacterium]|nr:RluA family pseudouridine synthase [Planctomycetota bacterium]
MSIQKELSYGPVTIEVPARSQARRLDQFLHARFPSYSRARLQSLIKLGAVTVNEKTVKPSYAIAGEDVIVIELPTEHHRKIEPEAIPLDILHEDAHLVVVNKPAGMVVHPARGNWSGTLVNALLHHCEALSSANEDPGRPGVVHRLDQYTSGVIVCAKSDEAYYKLGQQFEHRTTEKEYLTITDGEPESNEGEIDLPLGTDPQNRLLQAVRLIGGRRAITHYEVRERFGGYAFLRIRPKTGRTHQIRVHLRSMGCPCLADSAYSERKEFWPSDLGLEGESALIERQALHAFRLSIDHPATAERVTFEAPLPDDMQKALEALRCAGVE